MEVPLRRERIVIGRRADNDICLPNLAVSGEHAVVVTILADSFLEDLGSTNGTLVNGKAIAKHFLRDHDYIDIGRHKLVYLVDESEVLPKETIKAATPRAAVGDLGEMVELAKPIVRAKRTTAARARRETAAGTVGTRTEVTQRIVAFEDPLSPPPEEQPSAPADEPGAIGSLRILSGPSSGRLIKLVQAETTMGRAGIQVAAIVRAGEVFQLASGRALDAERYNAVRPRGDVGVERCAIEVVDAGGVRRSSAGWDARRGSFGRQCGCRGYRRGLIAPQLSANESQADSSHGTRKGDRSGASVDPGPGAGARSRLDKWDKLSCYDDFARQHVPYNVTFPVGNRDQARLSVHVNDAGMGLDGAAKRYLVLFIVSPVLRRGWHTTCSSGSASQMQRVRIYQHYGDRNETSTTGFHPDRTDDQAMTVAIWRHRVAGRCIRIM